MAQDVSLKRASTKRWYSLHRVRLVAREKARRHDRLAWLRSLKDGPCVDCGGRFDPVAMDFDHREAGSKSFALSQVSRGYSFKRMLEEIAKCDLVCANCHRVRTRDRLTRA